MKRISRRGFLKRVSLGAAGIAGGMAVPAAEHDGQAMPSSRPNILFAMADDWSWPHASAYGTKGLATPAFDRVAREGALFSRTYCAAPQCSPNRAAILTGKPIWQLEEAGTHGSIFPSKFDVYPDLLEAAGYHVGFTGKGWGPGDWKQGGRGRNPSGPEFNDKTLSDVPAAGIGSKDYAANFELFLESKSKERPFCFWFGGHEPHRTYEVGSGLRSGKSLDDVSVPSFLPDTSEVRSDLLDYFLEIEWFDAQLGKMLAILEAQGELDNTMIVVTGDNGMAFPSAKANVYEYGIRVPLAMRWPKRIMSGQRCDGIVSHLDLMPTFLTAAGVDIPTRMEGVSLLEALGPQATNVPWPRDHALAGRERHTHARYDNLGYPSRAIRTSDYLYIHNLKPDRWPAGDPEGYYDIDSSPTKTLMMERRDEFPGPFAQGFGKRPEEELFDIRGDEACTRNLAGEAKHEDTRKTLAARLATLLTEQGDPRVLGYGDVFDSYPRAQGGMRPELGGFAEPGAYNPKYRVDSKKP